MKTKIAIYHGYELGGSGSNEYTRYLARNLAQLGHDVVLICRDSDPAAHAWLTRAVSYSTSGEPTELFQRESLLEGRVTLHQLPATSVYPVYVKDKQRSGQVKSFPEMTDGELEEYHGAMVAVVQRALEDDRPDVLHANHLVYQPAVAAEACAAVGIPFYVVPHGSSIEYVVKKDPRFAQAARRGLEACAGVVWCSREVKQRVLGLYPELAAELEAHSHDVGIGVDTTLFSPVAPKARRGSLDRLAARGPGGGKSAAQVAELERALDDRNFSLVPQLNGGYDHKRPDESLPDVLSRLPADGDLLLSVGALTFGKGVQTLIAAMPGVLERRPDAHLLIVGAGKFREVLEGLVWALHSQNEALFDELVQRGRELEGLSTSGPLEDVFSYASDPDQRRILFEHGAQLKDHVHFLGRLDHELLCHVFPCCRLAVFPSIVHEASPLVFAESLANSVLPVAADHSGLRDGLDNLQPHLPERLSRWMRIEDGARRVPSVVESVVELLELLEREELGPKLRALAVEHHDWTSVARQLVEAAEALAALPHQPDLA